jgi:hypothetical protein
MERPFGPGSSSLGFSGLGERRPVRELYGAFRRPRNDADRSAGAFVGRTGALTGLPIEFDEAEGRLLLAGIGGELDMLYAVPVGADRILVAVLPNGGGSGGAPGPDGVWIQQSQRETGALVVHGMVADEVESVDLIVAGATHAARMGENAFGLWLEHTHEADLEQVVLHRRDGTTNAIDLRPK